MKKLKLLLIVFLVKTQLFGFLEAQTIQPYFYGLNSWMPPNVGSTSSVAGYNSSLGGNYDDIFTYSTLVQNTQVKLLRYGGTQHDINKPTLAQYNTFITQAISMGAQPLVQISFMNQCYIDRTANPTEPVANTANTIINSSYFINLINGIKGNVTYYSIGNEPNAYKATYGASFDLLPQDVATYFRIISEKIKTMDPGAIIVGPDLTYCDFAWVNPLIDKNNSQTNITGAIPSLPGQYYCDIFAFHAYPFPGLTQNRPAVINHPLVNFFNNELTNTRTRITSNSSNPNLTIAVTEMNVCSLNQPNNTVDDISANSFIAGQWMAEMFCRGMETPAGKAKVEFMVPWSVHEKNGNFLDAKDLGLLNGPYVSSTNLPTPRSTYNHLKLMTNFSGTFKKNLYNGSPSNPAELKAYAYRNAANEIGVLLMNQYQTSPSSWHFEDDFTITFNNSIPAGTFKMQLNENITSNPTYSCRIKTETTALLIFDASGKLKSRTEYSIDDAKNNLPPKTWSTGASDAFIADGNVWGGTDNGIEPYYGNDFDLPYSPDIWVRNYSNIRFNATGNGYDAIASAGVYSGPSCTRPQPTGQLSCDENADWTSNSLKAPRVFVRLHNRGCGATAPGKVEVWVRQSNTADYWNSNWTQVSTGVSVPSFAGAEYVVQIDWTNIADPTTGVPDPGTSSIDYCYVARFESTGDPMFWETKAPPFIPNVTTSGHNIKYNNNYAQDNKTIVNTSDNNFIFHWGNVGDAAMTASMRFNSTYLPGTPFTDAGIVSIDLGKELYEKWVKGGKKGSGIVDGREKWNHMSPTGAAHNHAPLNTDPAAAPYEIKVTGKDAYIENITLGPNELYAIKIKFNYTVKSNVQNEYSFDVRQYNNDVYSGAVRYVISPSVCGTISAGNDVTIGRQCSTILSASPIVDSAQYNWYDNKTGILIGSGAALQVNPSITTTYELEMKSPQGCIDYDIVTVNVNPAASCQIVSCPVIEFKDRTLARSETISGREAAVSGTLRIPQNVTLTIDNSKLNFLKDAQIEVMQGGRLEIINSELRGCSGDRWKGIVVRGNNKDNLQLKISGSILKDALAPVKADMVKGLNIAGSTFVYGSPAIELTNSRDFQISENQFYASETAVKTSGTIAGTGSAIEKNYIANAKTALSFTADNHSRLSIRCNTFDSYTDYAIYSSSTTLASQGTAAEGAGNSFISSSALVNNKLRHSGNTMTYYYDPSVPVALSAASGLTAIASPSQQDAACTPAVLRAGNTEQTGAIAAVKTYKLYPNPNSGSMNFEYTLSEGETGSFTIYDLTGRKIAQYVLDQSKTTLTINENSLQSGLYFYAAAVNGKVVDSNKIVIIK